MAAATAFSIPTSSTASSRRIAHWGALLSLLLHLVAVLVWVGPRLSPRPDPQPPTITVDIVPPNPPTDNGRPGGNGVGEPATEARQIPQLAPGAVADKPVPRAEAKGSGSGGATIGPAKPTPVTRNERDMVLAQVVRHWKPPPELLPYDKAEFKVRVTVLADGTLAPPFSVRAPYNPAAAIEGFDGLHPQDPRRRATEAFYRALRQAQPLRLPPQLAVKAPFPVILDFRVKDVR